MTINTRGVLGRVLRSSTTDPLNLISRFLDRFARRCSISDCRPASSRLASKRAIDVTSAQYFSITALVLCSCTGTDVGNPVVDLDFSLETPESTAKARPAAANVVAGVRVKNAWVSVDRIRMRSAADCTGSAQLELVGPFYVDLLAPGPIDSLRDIELSGESFCRFEFGWDASDSPVPANAPQELVETSFLLMGERSDSTEFILRSERNDDFRLDARDEAFSVDDATGSLFVAFNFTDLFAGIDLDEATVNGDGVILIDASSNSDILASFDDALADATRLFDDDDGDGTLDANEAEDADVLAD